MRLHFIIHFGTRRTLTHRLYHRVKPFCLLTLEWNADEFYTYCMTNLQDTDHFRNEPRSDDGLRPRADRVLPLLLLSLESSKIRGKKGENIIWKNTEQV